MEKILIIDDDKAFAETLTLFLSNSFTNVQYANSGEEGLSIVKKEIPDIVITDLRMPELDGLEVLKKIKEIDNSIAVIIITAFDETPCSLELMTILTNRTN